MKLCLVLAASVLLTSLGCQHALPGFAHVTEQHLQGASTRSITASPDGQRWLVVRSLTDALVYRDLHSAPSQRALPYLDFAGWLEGGRAFLASADTVEIWDADLRERVSREELTSSDPHLAGRHVQVSPSGRFVAKDVAVFDTQERRWLATVEPHGDQSVLSFHGDEWLLTAGFWDERVTLRNLREQRKLQWRVPGKVSSAAFDPTTGLVFVGTKRGLFTEPANGGASQKVVSGEILHVALLDQGRSLAALTPRKLLLIDARSRKVRASFRLRAEGRVLAADGSLIVVGDSAGGVYAWESRSAQAMVGQVVLGGPIAGLALSATTRRVLAASSDADGTTLVMLALPGP